MRWATPRPEGRRREGAGVAIRDMVAGLVLWAALGLPGAAQEAAPGQAWIQVEALPTLGRAQTAAEGYASHSETCISQVVRPHTSGRGI